MKRDVKRIETILNKFKEIWNEVPDQRFLQLISNIIREAEIYSDTFYTEDDIWIKALNSYSRKNKEVPINPTKEEWDDLVKINKKPKKKKKSYNKKQIKDSQN